MVDELLLGIIFVISFTLFWIVRLFFIDINRGPNTPKSRKEWIKGLMSEGWTGYALIILTPLQMFYVLLYCLYVRIPSWFEWNHLMIPDLWRYVGVLPLLLSIPLVAKVHQILGTHYSYDLETKKTQKLIKYGPYTTVRHPLYSSHILFNLGMVLVTANLLLTLIALIELPLIYGRILREEKMMLEQFGEEYEDYKKYTGRIFPKLRE